MEFFKIVTENSSFYAIVSFWCHNNLRRQTKHERHGIDIQCLTCEALERLKQKIGKSKLPCYQNVSNILTKKMNASTW